MRERPRHEPFILPAQAEFVRLRQALGDAGFSEQAVVERLGAVEVPTRRARNLPRLLSACSGGSPLDTLIRLFILGVHVEQEAACAAMSAGLVQTWRAAGLLETHAGTIAAPVKLLPYGDLLLACDPPEQLEDGAEQDIVMGMTGSSLALLNFAIPVAAAAALDVGTGCGVQAFLAAARCGRVVATDSNARALAFARFNAALNGIGNIEFRNGSGLEPVRAERFDLIVCNPPFMISPGCRYSYRDSGMTDDAFCEKMVRESAPLLNEGGWAQFCLEWAHYAGQDWRERLAGWVAGSGCDAWIILTDTQDPAVYADNWIRDTEQDDPLAWAPLYDLFLSHYRERGIEAISSGLIALRKRSGGRNWLRMDEAPEQRPEPFGEFVRLGFRLKDFVEESATDDVLLASKLRVSPDARLEQQSRCVDGAWRPWVTQVHLQRGLQYRGGIDGNVAALLAGFDGSRTAGEVLAAIAARMGVEVSRLAHGSLPVLRKFVERGFLLPEGIEPPGAPRP